MIATVNPKEAATRARECLALLLFGVMVPTAAMAQSRIIPSNEVVLTGYGTVGYRFDTQGENANRFFSSVSPVFLFQFQDRVLFETELEFELNEGITETGLEYAVIDFIASNNLVLAAGKFLLPFGIFGERLHPTWINKFATPPPIYGHGSTGLGAAPLMAVLSDVGVMARGAFTPGRFQIGLNGYVTQGPSGEDNGGALVDVELPASSDDNNINKMMGGRVDIALPPRAQLSFSVLNGDYDDNGVLDFTAWNIAGEVRFNGLEIRGEVLQTRQEFETQTAFPTQVRTGLYAQVARRFGPWETVLRWTQLFNDEIDGVTTEGSGAKQLGIGLDYWINPSIAIMGAYELNSENGVTLQNDRLITHIAFGF